MDILYPCCAGLDVHKQTVVVTLRRLDQGKVRQYTRTYGTMTEQLLELADWLEAEGVSHVAMESTGVYWKPIWNLLEDRFQILLVNAQKGKRGRESNRFGSRRLSAPVSRDPLCLRRDHRRRQRRQQQ